MSQKLMGLSDRRILIPGTGHVESLNVAMAAGILLAEHWRARAR
jgi:tRNA G18 (ribose-2'-O)-methylase SpoU